MWGGAFESGKQLSTVSARGQAATNQGRRKEEGTKGLTRIVVGYRRPRRPRLGHQGDPLGVLGRGNSQC